MTHARVIPSIDQLRQHEVVQRLETRYGRDATLAALRRETAVLRERLMSGGGNDGPEARPDDRPADPEAAAAVILARLEPSLRAAVAPSLRPVINATGVIVHTNLGRAPLAQAALDRIAAVASGYANLEYDLAAGARGSRTVHAATLLTQLTGAEAAVVVNNNAAAVLLVLAALADGREVIISRGELVEIGGGFRIPDVLRQSGAVLREVGTTNRTRAADYAAALGERTALILRVHPSNFRIEGFTERPALAELAALGARFDVPVVEDLGSGCLEANHVLDEPTVGASIDAGVGVCTFSGDKLLGGPQAGIIVGRRALLDPIRRHPLMRALRVDKLTFAALEGTLIEHAAGRAERNRAGGADDRPDRLPSWPHGPTRCASGWMASRACASPWRRPKRPSAGVAHRGSRSKAAPSWSRRPAGRPTTSPLHCAPAIRQWSVASPTARCGWTSGPFRRSRMTYWPRRWNGSRTPVVRRTPVRHKRRKGQA